MKENVIPIFPLTIVACPTELIPLHIFEERYKDMVAFCQDVQQHGDLGEFAILLLSRSDCPAEIGSTVSIQKVLKEYQDGRLDIVTLGQRRCRILEIYNEQPYSTAKVEYFQDVEKDWNEELANQAFQKHRELTRLVTSKIPGDELYSGKSGLSFHLIPTSGLTSKQKQQMIEMQSENERLEFLIKHYNKLLKVLPDVLKSVESIHAQWQVQKIITESD